MTKSEKQKRRKELLKDLEYVLILCNEVANHAPEVIAYYDREIERIIEELKNLGK